MTKQKEQTSNHLIKLKQQLEEVRNESFKQGIWEGERRTKQDILRQVEELIDNMIPYDEEGTVYQDLINREKLKQSLKEIK